MTDASRTLPPAGWYPDSDPGSERFFDGVQWTTTTRPRAGIPLQPPALDPTAQWQPEGSAAEASSTVTTTGGDGAYPSRRALRAARTQAVETQAVDKAPVAGQSEYPAQPAPTQASAAVAQSAYRTQSAAPTEYPAPVATRYPAQNPWPYAAPRPSSAGLTVGFIAFLVSVAAGAFIAMRDLGHPFLVPKFQEPWIAGVPVAGAALVLSIVGLSVAIKARRGAWISVVALIFAVIVGAGATLQQLGASARESDYVAALNTPATAKYTPAMSDRELVKLGYALCRAAEDPTDVSGLASVVTADKITGLSAGYVGAKAVQTICPQEYSNFVTLVNAAQAATPTS